MLTWLPSRLAWQPLSHLRPEVLHALWYPFSPPAAATLGATHRFGAGGSRCPVRPWGLHRGGPARQGRVRAEAVIGPPPTHCISRTCGDLVRGVRRSRRQNPSDPDHDCATPAPLPAHQKRGARPRPTYIGAGREQRLANTSPNGRPRVCTDAPIAAWGMKPALETNSSLQRGQFERGEPGQATRGPTSAW